MIPEKRNKRHLTFAKRHRSIGLRTNARMLISEAETGGGARDGERTADGGGRGGRLSGIGEQKRDRIETEVCSGEGQVMSENTD